MCNIRNIHVKVHHLMCFSLQLAKGCHMLQVSWLLRPTTLATSVLLSSRMEML